MMVKICGITRREDALVAVEAGASAIGFIFYPKSPRYVTPSAAADLGAGLNTWKVGVFVDESPSAIAAVMQAAKLDVAQVYGDALPENIRVWKAVRSAEPRASASGQTLDFPPLDGDHPAALVYTSGTTGQSKGAILTHNNFAANALNLLTCWQITDRDRLLLTLPLFHVHALGNGLHCWLISGCRMRLLERFEHQTAVEQFLDFRPTLFFGVPTIYVRLLESPPAEAKQIGQSMRLFVSGSAPLPAHVLEEFRQLFGHTILERYGMTETIMNISNPYVGERRPGSVGLPLPGVSVRLSETGEILLKGPNVFAGYWKRDDATREAFLDGWFKTGDIATRSDDGYYTLSGRKSDLIISGGFNIYPREIEEFLMEQPEIVEAAVVGEPDRLRGEIPVAYIVVSESVDSDVLIERCKANLSSFKVPRRVKIVDLLPRNALGKVQKHLLCRAS
jgi:malonyl-CoA/methylmalonyl-CoA synthetase